MSPQLSVSSSNLDGVLEGVKTEIGETFDVSGPGPDIAARLGVHRGQPPNTLDLVSHSAGVKFLLLLGDGNPNQESFLIENPPQNSWRQTLLERPMRNEVERLGIKELRLLGCLTAFSPEGRATMKDLKEQLRLDEVFGTNNYLTADDFEPGGFKTSSAPKLLSCTEIADPQFIAPLQPPDPPPDSPDVLGLDLGKVPAMTPDELKRLRPSPGWVPRSQLLEFGARETENMYRAMGDKGLRKGVSLSGLLSVPAREYWIEVQGDPGRNRLLQVLFDWHMVRVFSPELMVSRSKSADPNNLLNHSAVYRVEDPKGLKQFMTNHKPQVEITSLK